MLKTLTSIHDIQFSDKTVVTIGTFDGVHLGHRQILDRVVQQAKAAGLKSAVLSFFPHPRMVLQDQSDIRLLNTIAEKKRLLEETGLDYLVIHPFDREFSRLTAEEFVADVLVSRFKIAKIIIGHDHRFGRNRTANIDDLVIFGQQYGFEVEQITAREIDEIAISSTKIRTALAQGNIDLANRYLGYAYRLSGQVVSGRQLGRTIGFPTANISGIEPYKLIPKQGVYLVKSTCSGTEVFGMMNIGTRPTVDGQNLAVEVHFLNFDADLYGQNLDVELLRYLREESKFDSLDALKAQINLDREAALHYIASR